MLRSRLIGGAAFASGVLAVGYLVLIKVAPVPILPELLAVFMILFAVALVVEAGVTSVWLFRRQDRRLATSGRLILALGLLAVVSGGTLNWLLGLQGSMILSEGDQVPLFGGSHLQGFEAGPLADPAELGIIVKLAEVVLVPVKGGFSPELHLLVGHQEGEPEQLVVEGMGRTKSGPLWFHGGAFGYAPRVVFAEGERTLFDRVVPFLSRRDDAGRIAFEGGFEVEAHGLELEGRILLDSLDEQLRGHPLLAMNVTQDGTATGSGVLKLGEFADLENGVKVGFVGLGMWAEIVVSRRTYSEPMFGGAALALGGLILWIGAAIYGRFR